MHDLVPHGHEVVHELLLRVVGCVDLREGTELGVRTEDRVDAAAGPFELAVSAPERSVMMSSPSPPSALLSRRQCQVRHDAAVARGQVIPAGDRVIVETPGGGGMGDPTTKERSRQDCERCT